MCAKSRANAPWWFCAFETPITLLPCTLTLNDADLAHHARHVMRLRVGGCVVLVDESTASAYVATIEGLSSKTLTVTLQDALPEQPAPKPLWAVVSVIKEQRWDWTLQKLTELGVTHIVPLLADRSVAHGASANKQARWEKILRQAAQQSEQTRLPRLYEPMALDAVLELIPTESLKLAALERTACPVAQVLPDSLAASSVTVAIGPEGGWTDAEVSTLLNHGFTPVSLGGPILRAETAAVVLSGILRHGV